jgi:hypothetical protein
MMGHNVVGDLSLDYSALPLAPFAQRVCYQLRPSSVLAPACAGVPGVIRSVVIGITSATQLVGR